MCLRALVNGIMFVIYMYIYIHIFHVCPHTSKLVVVRYLQLKMLVSAGNKCMCPTIQVQFEDGNK